MKQQYKKLLIHSCLVLTLVLILFSSKVNGVNCEDNTQCGNDDDCGIGKRCSKETICSSDVCGGCDNLINRSRCVDGNGGGGGGGGGSTPTPTVTQNPDSAPTATPLTPPTNLTYSCSGWNATFSWTKSADTRVDSYAVRINYNNGWANDNNNPIWFMYDGSDKFIGTSNVNNVSTIIIPMRQYYNWSVQSTNATNRNFNPASTAPGTPFTCIPNYTLPTGASCRRADSSLDPGCDINYFKSQYIKQYGYPDMESISTFDPNLIRGRNAYKAILTDAVTAKKELIDLLDFEEWRKLKNSTPNTTTPTLTPTSTPTPTLNITLTTVTPIPPTSTTVPPAPTSINTPILSLEPTIAPVD